VGKKSESAIRTISLTLKKGDADLCEAKKLFCALKVPPGISKRGGHGQFKPTP